MDLNMLSTFTFYYIYIKTISVEIDKLLNKRFTFYYIYIKTKITPHNLVSNVS